MDQCLFCRIVSGEIPAATVYEDDDLIVFLDLNQAARGHLLIVPRTHVASWHETDWEILASMSRIAAEMAPAVVQAMEADGYNLQLNNGRAAGQEIFHVHLHLIPRWKRDGYISPPPHRQAGAEELRGTASLIRETKAQLGFG